MATPTRTLSRPGRILLVLVLLLLTTALLFQQCSTQSRTDQSPSDLQHYKNTPRFAILVMTTSETTYDHISFSTKHTYSLKHNYDLIWDFSPSFAYPKVWDKLNMSRDAIANALSGETSYDWIWMLDFDTLITNSSIRLEDVVEQSLAYAESVDGGKKDREDVNLILTRDCDPLNLGSFFLRASEWTLSFIEEWRSGGDVTDEQGHLHNEQDVLRDMLLANSFSVADKSVLAPQHLFDAYPEELECYDPRDPRPWVPGMFLLHFAGARWRLKGEKDPVGMLMRKYYEAVVDE